MFADKCDGCQNDMHSIMCANVTPTAGGFDVDDEDYSQDFCESCLMQRAICKHSQFLCNVT